MPSPASLRAAGTGAGLDVVEVTSAEPFVEVRRTLEERKAAGLHGGMAFTYRQPARSTDPEAALRSAPGPSSSGARSYLVDDAADAPASPSGQIARYAWDDHYALLKAGLKAMAAVLKAHGWRARVLADDNAMVDRAAAHRAGIGWWGKNANLLLPGLGSWYVLGSVVTDAPLAAVGGPVADRCGSCTRCLDGCPTGAITAPGVVDARRCLSWLLQAEGPFPREHRVALGDRIYGCDDCQEVCPPNRRAPIRLARRATSAPWAPLLDLLDPDDAVVLAPADRWYIPGARCATCAATRSSCSATWATATTPRSSRVAPPPPRTTPTRCCAATPSGRPGASDARICSPALAHEHDPFVLEELAALAPMTHLFVTNDFPPKIGGIQTMLWELWRRLDPDLVHGAHHRPPRRPRRGTPSSRSGSCGRAGVGAAAHPVAGPPHRRAGRRDRRRPVVLDPALPVGLVGPRLRRPYAVVLHGAEVTVPGRLPGADLRAAARAARRGARHRGRWLPAGRGRAGRGPALPSVVVPPGVDTERFRPLDADERAAVAGPARAARRRARSS